MDLVGRNMREAHRRGGLLVKASGLTIAALLSHPISPASAQTAPAAETNSGTTQGGSGEIVVTAQRRSERVVDVPYNITAVNSAGLVAAGAVNANDLVKVVPGLGNFADGPADRFGENNFSLRGLRTDPAGPNASIKYSVSSVSTYYGDVPVFFSVLLKDIDRVEVLRGPQGTLYGSGAQAGAIRFIPNRPQFDKVSGEVNGSTGITQHAHRLNGSGDGVINVPLAENLAVRVSAAYVYQAGFIDQVDLFHKDAAGVPVPSIPGDLTSGPVVAPVKKGTNSWDQWMTRGALRYKPTDWLDLEVDYLHQESNSKDTQVTNPDFQGGSVDLSDGTWPNAAYQARPGGRYENTQPILQPVKNKVDLVSGTAAIDLGFATLSSITSYYNNRVKSVNSINTGYETPDFNVLYFYNYYPRFAGVSEFAGRERGFTQEVRLVSEGNKPFTYVIGGYYQRQNRFAHYDYTAPGVYAFSQAACATGYDAAFLGCQTGVNPQLGDQIFTATQKFLTKDLAAYGELTYHVTRRWQVTGGIRVFKSTQSFSTFETFPFIGPDFGDGVTEPISQGALLLANKERASRPIFKVNTSYDLDRNNKVYFTFAQGFRRGGANPLSTTGASASLPQYLNFKPDIANNYEVGIKGITLGHKLTYALSAYWIDLKNFQFYGLTPAQYTAIFNGAKARSRGVELEASYRLTPTLTISGSYDYTDAKVAKTTVLRDYAYATLITDPTPVIIDNPGATVTKGSVLPGVSKHTVSAAVDYAIPLSGDSRIIIHGNGNYRSKQNNMLSLASANFAVIPGVFTADARITYDSGKGWSGSLFVNNLTNAFASSGTLGTQTANVAEPQGLAYAGKIIQTPRTVGLSLHYGF